MLDSYEIRIRKEALKFAASHMTVFPDGTKEALHGHNYFLFHGLMLVLVSYYSGNN